MAGRRDRARRARERTIALIRQRSHVIVKVVRVLPRQQHPDGIALDYWRALEPLVNKTRDVIARVLLPYLPHILDTHAAERDGERNDGQRFDVAKLADMFKKAATEVADLIEPKQLHWLANEVGTQTADYQKVQLNTSVRAAFGVDLSAVEPSVTSQIAAFTADNVRLVGSIPRQYLGEVETSVMNAVRGGLRWDKIAEHIEERYSVATSRAQLIARDQVGKFFGTLNKVRQEGLGVTGYTWRTMNDEAVREEHADREGERFEWDDPPDDGAPGEAIQCRCYAEPDFSGVVDGLSDTP